MALMLSDRYRFCIANHRAVLLDIRDGSYACLPDDMDKAFRHLAEGGKGTPDVTRALQPLIEDEILVINCGGLGLADVPKIPTATSSLYDEVEHELSICPDISRLAQRVLSEWAIDRRPLAKTLRHLNRPRRSPRRDLHDPTVQATLRAHLATRRWLVTHDRCLPWSVSLVDVLRDRGAEVRLVIGVRTAPWAAHAWAEHEGTVLNDSLDNVSPYTPILAA